jgi:hypothetical protein
MLKTFQRLGYFVQPDDVPPATTTHVAAAAGLGHAVGEPEHRGPLASEVALASAENRAFHRVWPVFAGTISSKSRSVVFWRRLRRGKQGLVVAAPSGETAIDAFQ